MVRSLQVRLGILASEVGVTEGSDSGAHRCYPGGRGRGGRARGEDCGSHLNEHGSVSGGTRVACTHVSFPGPRAAPSVPYLGSTPRIRKAGLVSDRRSRLTGHSFPWEAKLNGQGLLGPTVSCACTPGRPGQCSPSSA